MFVIATQSRARKSDVTCSRKRRDHSQRERQARSQVSFFLFGGKFAKTSDPTGLKHCMLILGDEYSRQSANGQEGTSIQKVSLVGDTE